MLASNGAKSSREQLTLIRVFEALRGLGYVGGYDAVQRYARSWSHEVVLIGGTTVTIKVAQLRLCNSRMLFARA